MKLIALAIIAAGVLAADSKEVAVGASFEAPNDIAKTLIDDGRAKEDVEGKDPAAAAAAEQSKKAKTTKVRVLVDCEYGKANDVAVLESDQVKNATNGGFVDPAKEAVAYAESLKNGKA